MENPEVRLSMPPEGPNAFEIFDEEGKQGEMIFDISAGNLTVYHTEVEPAREGKGYAGLLLNAMVEYVRANQLKVIPMCVYVHAQFKRHAERYADIWNKQ
ncbi:GNAT family N-acetyltransferase [Pedobacter sp. AW31-3R]|uniref:GNAT family N-acetyltransferase n=1 Tax=Pedobacter sp. AW31-3R TaxID=3445781 RepID=UPI003FA100E5